MKTIKTDKAPKAIGPYSQAILVNGFLYLSGQIPLDPKTNMVHTGDIEDSANLVFKNIGEILNEAGYSYNDVIKTTLFIKDMNQFAKINEIYAIYFVSNPARSCVEVSRLPKDVLIEAEVIAYKE